MGGEDTSGHALTISQKIKTPVSEVTEKKKNREGKWDGMEVGVTMLESPG